MFPIANPKMLKLLFCWICWYCAPHILSHSIYSWLKSFHLLCPLFYSFENVWLKDCPISKNLNILNASLFTKFVQRQERDWARPPPKLDLSNHCIATWSVHASIYLWDWKPLSYMILVKRSLIIADMCGYLFIKRSMWYK